MIQDSEIPKNLGELFRNPQKIRDAFVLLRQIANLKVITDDRPITTPKLFPTSRDMTLDLRSGTPTGALIPTPGGPFIPYANNAFIVCQTTNSGTGNATLLRLAYAAAKALLPNGVPLSATNRAAVIVMPGVYDFGTSEFFLDTQYVDLIGLSTNRDDQYFTSTLNATNLGTIHKSVDDVVVANISVTCVFTTTGNSAAWYPDAGYPAERLINCRFSETPASFGGLHSMRYDQGYSGYYEDCQAGGYGWGQGSNFAGVAVNCTVVGEGGFGSNATCSGVLVNCECKSRYGFGGQGGTFTGKAFNCRAVENCFGGDNGSHLGSFAGEAYNCVVTGTNAFGNGGHISAGAKIIGCVYRADTFITPDAGGFIVGSIDSTGIVNFPAIGFSNPMTTSGDTIYGGAAGVATRLPIGANGAIHYVASNLPAWLAPTLKGAILYLNASLVPTWLAPGFNGATLQLAGGLPVWVGGSPPGDLGNDYLAGQVFNTLDRQVFNISTYNG